MIQEAKDEQGNWRPIEFWEYSSCGNSYYNLTLSPNEILVVKSIKYTGDFETELRFKLPVDQQVFYSPSFSGKINKTQFVR